MQEGYGACLLQKPHMLADMITAARSRVSSSEDFTVSIKIRLHDNIKYVRNVFFKLLILVYILVFWGPSFETFYDIAKMFSTVCII